MRFLQEALVLFGALAHFAISVLREVSENAILSPIDHFFIEGACGCLPLC